MSDQEYIPLLADTTSTGSSGSGLLGSGDIGGIESGGTAGSGSGTERILNDHVSRFIYTPQTVSKNFHTLSLAFSMNHAIVVTCLAFTSTLLGDSLGSTALGVMYVCFAISAFLAANVIVLGVGSKDALVFGMIGYLIQTAGFFVSLILKVVSIYLAWPVTIISYGIGGIAAGIVWTAQGRLYRLHAKLYAERAKVELPYVNTYFASLFTSYFLGFETIIKIFASAVFIIFSTSSLLTIILFAIYVFASIVTVYMTNHIIDLEEDVNPQRDNLTSSPSLIDLAASYSGQQIISANDPTSSKGSSTPIKTSTSSSTPTATTTKRSTNKKKKSLFDWDFSLIKMTALLAANMLRKDRKLALIMPFQIAFGLTSSMVTYYVLGTVVADSSSLGSEYVGLFAGLVVLSGALMSSPMAHYANLKGKAFIISIGNAALLGCSVIMLAFNDEEIGTFGMMLLFSIVFGLGRGVWENTNKAVVADFYQEDSIACTAAFSTVAFFMGYSSAIGFFCFFYMTRRTMCIVILCFSVISMMCYPMAFHVCNEQRELKLREEAILKGRKEQLEQLQMMRDRDVVIATDEREKHYRQVTLHHPKAPSVLDGPSSASRVGSRSQYEDDDEFDIESDHYFIDKVRKSTATATSTTSTTATTATPSKPTNSHSQSSSSSSKNNVHSNSHISSNSNSNSNSGSNSSNSSYHAYTSIADIGESVTL